MKHFNSKYTAKGHDTRHLPPHPALVHPPTSNLLIHFFSKTPAKHNIKYKHIVASTSSPPRSFFHNFLQRSTFVIISKSCVSKPQLPTSFYAPVLSLIGYLARPVQPTEMCQQVILMELPLLPLGLAVLRLPGWA